MQRTSRWIGLALCSSLIVLALASTSSLASFLDLRGLTLTVGLTLGGLWASFGHARLVAAFTRALTGRGDEREHLAARAVLARGHALAWSSGALACLIGVWLELTALESPTHFISGLARASLSILYGALLAELLFAHLKHWLADGESTAAGERRTA